MSKELTDLTQRLKEKKGFLLFILGIVLFLLGIPVFAAFIEDVFGNTWITVAGSILVVSLSIYCFKVSGEIDDRAIEKQKIEDKRAAAEIAEREYLIWCEPQTKEEEVLQKLADGLLGIYEWDGMPRIKARLNPEIEDKDDTLAHYSGGFRSYRRPGHQAVEYSPSYYYRGDIESLKQTMKHELVHAWVDWLDLDERSLRRDAPKYIENLEGHEEVFIWKCHDIGFDPRHILHSYPSRQNMINEIVEKRERYFTVETKVARARERKQKEINR